MDETYIGCGLIVVGTVVGAVVMYFVGRAVRRSDERRIRMYRNASRFASEYETEHVAMFEPPNVMGSKDSVGQKYGVPLHYHEIKPSKPWPVPGSARVVAEETLNRSAGDFVSVANPIDPLLFAVVLSPDAPSHSHPSTHDSGSSHGHHESAHHDSGGGWGGDSGGGGSDGGGSGGSD